MADNGFNGISLEDLAVDYVDTQWPDDDAQAEMHYWNTLEAFAGLCMSYGYDSIMADLTPILNKKIEEVDKSL